MKNFKIVYFMLFLTKTCLSFDPMLDLRTPQSLFESLQCGINDMYHMSMQYLTDKKNAGSGAMNHSSYDAQGLLALCDTIDNSTKQNAITPQDREYLQNIIDRIDGLIAQLEGDDSDNQIEDDFLRDMKASCHALKAKIGF